ncbi:basic proline-rich protein-like [Neopelma chrysocephalum]|uniref:basic proline-rich protein-like n=1 Tax=Neopelma chrysocephalum TaxID=114329 RepID=UPI000FCCF04E|nr:basic proline-rich protein-like [Neopelma chrysocephalum]
MTQAAWGCGVSCKGTSPTQEDVGGPRGCDPLHSSPPSIPGTPTDIGFAGAAAPPGWIPPTPAGLAVPRWDGPGRAPPALPPRRFRANFQRAGRRRRRPCRDQAGRGAPPPSCAPPPAGPIQHPPAPEGAEGTREGTGPPPRPPRAPAWLRARLPPKPEGEGRGCRDGASHAGHPPPARTPLTGTLRGGDRGCEGVSPRAPHSEGRGGGAGTGRVQRGRAVRVSPPSGSAGIPAPSAPGSLQNRAARPPRGSPMKCGGQPMAGSPRHPALLPPGAPARAIAAHGSLRMGPLVGTSSPGPPSSAPLPPKRCPGGRAGSPLYRSRSLLPPHRSRLIDPSHCPAPPPVRP